jgi:Putative MetA-pathway of phenol degradation
VRVWASIVLLFFGLGPAHAAEKRPIDVIEDNSFLVEEAYNQEAGLVQHVLTAAYNNDSRRRGWDFSFTQEWPVFSQDHQFSYAIPWSHFIDGADRIYGVGDAILSYRYQALEEDDRKPALAPRFTLILPTGNRDRGTGNGVVGYEWGLPFSKKLASRFAMHANFDVTYLPGVRARLDGSRGRLSPRHSLLSYKAGASGVFAVLPRFHLMLEWIGDFEEDIDDRGRAVREFRPMIAPGFRAAAVDGEKLQVVVGGAMPVGLNRKADDYGAFFYLSIEHDFY